jgi:hypothetical protein
MFRHRSAFHQGVLHQQRSVGPAGISATIRPYFLHKSLNALKCSELQITHQPVHIATTLTSAIVCPYRYNTNTTQRQIKKIRIVVRIDGLQWISFDVEGLRVGTGN